MHTQIKFCQSWQLGIAVLLTMVGVVAEVGDRTFAQSQIVPDNTLGTESSVVTPNVEINELKSDRIDGGAIRGSNLFHSFQDFNVWEGGGVYFTNPQGIENILGRVTGANRSEILGTLGVLGNANLFLLNPNGIVFGQNASLDVQGSFFATTAEAIALGKQGYFSATQPQQSSLLSVSPGALFFNQVASQPGNIINRGNLSAGKDLTLAGGNLDLQGQLYAGENLSLQATDTAKIRDSEASPFLARSGADLAIVGNQALDILALNHPTQTPFVSGGNLSLISDGTISGDARFSSGGSFSIQNLSGGLANFVSKYDPIISSNGDVDVAANYTGASLLVESKGNIRFQGGVNITAPDTSALPAGQDTATLSKSTALIMRSGQNILAYGGINSGSVPALRSGTVPEGITLSGNLRLQPFNGTGGIVNLTTASGNVSTQEIFTNGGAININSVGAINTNGKQLVTINDAQNGGDINLKANNDITTARLFSYSRSNGNVGNGGLINLETENGSITTDGLYSYSYSELGGSTGNAGTIFLSAFNNITTGGINSETGSTGDGGNITLSSINGSIDTTKGDIISGIRGSNGTGRAGTIVFTAKDNIQTAVLNASAEKRDGGNIQLTSTNGAIDTTRGSLFTYSRSRNGGAIAFSAGGNITTGNLNSYSYSESGSVGNGGAISLKADNGSITTGRMNSSSDSRSGNAGNGGVINLQANNANITTDDLLSYSYSPPVESGGNGGAITFAANGDITTGRMNSKAGGTGNGGDITLTSNAGAIDTTKGAIASEIRQDSNGSGRAGTIVFTAKNNIQTNELDASAETGDSGNIQLTSTNGAIDTTAGKLFTDTRLIDSGNGGKITLQAEGDITTKGMRSDGGTFGISGDITITSDTGTILVNGGEINSKNYGTGEGGDINIAATAGPIFLTNGAGLIASTEGQGNAGRINIFAYDTVSFDDSGASTDTNSTGNGGDIKIATTGSLSLTNGAILRIRTFGEGNAGSINVNAEQLSLSTNSAIEGDVNKDAKGRGGNINLNVTGTILLRGAITTPTPGFLWTGESTRITIGVLSGGIGSGGTLKIEAGSLVLTDGAIIKNSTQGQGDAGKINVKADTVDISGSVPSSGLPSGLFTSTDTNGSAGEIVVNTGTFRIAKGAALSARSKGDGQGGKIEVNATSFEAVNGGQLVTTTFGRGQAGNIFVNTTDRVTISGSDPNYTNRIAQFPNPINEFVANAITETGSNSGLFANTQPKSTGNGGEIRIDTSNFNLTDSAQISTSTSGKGVGGNIIVNATQSLDLSNEASLLAQSYGAAPAGNVTINTKNLTATNSSIETSSNQSSGGNITISRDSTNPDNPIRADKIRLKGDSDITTNVESGKGNGGNITLTADSIFAFDNSDILAFASGGTGGKITFDTPAFFGQNYAPRDTDNPRTLDWNNSVDVNASGAVSGVITLPDTSFIQNSLNQLPENLIDTSTLIANSCIARTSRQQQGSFTITGSGGLPTRPGDALMSTYTFGNVRSVSNADSSTLSTRRPWRKGDPIVEPQGVYRLSSGQLVLIRECP